MSLRHDRALPPRQGRLDRLFNFTRVELASARLASLAIGVQPAVACPGDKRDREEGEEEASHDLLVQAEAALRGVEDVSIERLRALSSQIYAVLECGLVAPRTKNALRWAAERLQAAEVARDSDSTQMPDYDADGFHAGEEVEHELSQLERDVEQKTQGDELRPARRTRRAEEVEARLQDVLARASEAVRAAEKLSAEEAEEEAGAQAQRRLAEVLGELRDMPHTRAATWRLVLGAQLARLAQARGDAAAAEFRESQVEAELAKAREQRQRSAQMEAAEEEADEEEDAEADAMEAADDFGPTLPSGQFRVEKILDRYQAIDGTFYFVKWVGYKVGVDAWQQADNVEPSLIGTFELFHGVLSTGQDDLHRVLSRRPRQAYLVEAKRGYTVKLDRARMLPATLAKADAFDADEAARRRREGAGGGGGRPAAAGRADGEGSDGDDAGGDGVGGGGGGDGGDGGGDDGSGDGGGGGGSGGGDGGGDGRGGGGGGGSQGARSQVGRLLVWDSNTSDLRLSVRLALRDGNFVVQNRTLWDSLIEWTITRLWLLETVAPPSGVVNDEATLWRIAKTYYSIEKAAFDSEFKMVLGGPTYQQHHDNEVALMVRRMRLRWERLRSRTEQERDELRSQLRALRHIGHTRGFAPLPAPYPTDARADRLVADADNPRWWVAYATPNARSTKQNNLMRYRNAETRRFLYWMRQQWYPPTPRRSLEAQRSDGLGSVFDGKIPTSALEASVTQVEHTVAQSWFENTELMQEFCHVREDINNTLPIPAMQNAKKGAKPIWFVSDVPSEPDKADHSWFAPEDRRLFSPQRQAAVAARIFYTFLSNPLVTQQNDAQSALDRQGKGCSYYANQHVHAHMLATVLDRRPPVHDLYENLVILYVFRTYNPLLQEATTLQTHEFASDFRYLLKERLEGSTSFPALCGAALKSAVSGFPV